MHACLKYIAINKSSTYEGKTERIILLIAEIGFASRFFVWKSLYRGKFIYLNNSYRI